MRFGLWFARRCLQLWDLPSLHGFTAEVQVLSVMPFIGLIILSGFIYLICIYLIHHISVWPTHNTMVQPKLPSKAAGPHLTVHIPFSVSIESVLILKVWKKVDFSSVCKMLLCKRVYIYIYYFLFFLHLSYLWCADHPLFLQFLSIIHLRGNYRFECWLGIYAKG